MNVQTFLFHNGQYMAYGFTWLIHCCYIGTLVRRRSRLRQQMREVGKQ
jgi:hypothetical protein